MQVVQVQCPAQHRSIAAVHDQMSVYVDTEIKLVWNSLLLKDQ